MSDIDTPDPLLMALRSPSEETRIWALHRVCPCAAPFARYERYMDEVRLLKKDPSPSVRKIAIHVEQDAGGVEAVEARRHQAEELGVRYADRKFVRNWRHKRARRG